MEPIDFPEAHVTLAKDQPEYKPLPVYRPGHAENPLGVATSCWHLSWAERLRLLYTGRLWLNQITFWQPLQPQRPSLIEPWEE
jgi:hypothetical protein